MRIDTAKLKKCRQSAGFTQKEMAKKIGVSEISYQYYELGIRNPKVKAIQRMELVLGAKICIDEKEEVYALIKNIVEDMRVAKNMLCVDNIGDMSVNDIIELLKGLKLR